VAQESHNQRVRRMLNSKLRLLSLHTDLHKYTVPDMSDEGYGVDMLIDDPRVVACAVAAHNVNKAWCEAHNDFSQPAFKNLSAELYESCIFGVVGVIVERKTPKDSHDAWMQHRLENGWVYGEVTDKANKIHSCLVPYEKLPEMQKAKDTLFVNTVLEVAASLGIA
jgi:hypothetical protein